MSRLNCYLDREEECFGQIAEVPYASPLWHCTLRTEGESLDGVVTDSAAWAVDDTNGGDPWAMLAEFMGYFGAPLRDTPWDLWSLAMRAVAENPPEAIFEERTGFILHRDVIEYLFIRDEGCNQSVIDRAIDRATGGGMVKCINPMCASTAAFIASDHGEVSMPPFYVRCPQCGTQGPKVDTPHWDEEGLDACAAEALELWGDIAAAVQAGVKAQEVSRG